MIELDGLWFIKLGTSKRLTLWAVAEDSSSFIIIFGNNKYNQYLTESEQGKMIQKSN